ncbi:hypothetical protein Q757_01980 [Oenococcus alcoholitolerans]|uniref:Uncharacterized protein n=1 Tax=Oenococcus alcoholitolerans TaxID=931074 RepID=A0ABR4XSL7_9LACO|nr:hypothetical protein Q757_01980 [Oenococcus alcoholitolerans]
MKTLSENNPGWKEAIEDIDDLRAILQFQTDHSTEQQEEHGRLASDLVKVSDPDTKTMIIEKQARLRKFLG